MKRNQFAAKCAKCSRAIGASDWVRRAREQVYHLACFACDACKRQLSTGEEFALHDGRVLCKSHYFELLDGASGSNDENSEQECGSGSSGGGSGGGGGSKAKTKRVRTTFTEEQLQVLQANFNLDSNPDGQDLERIAQITGLSKRVTQVWFQNSRARQKKYFNNQAKKAFGKEAHLVDTTVGSLNEAGKYRSPIHTAKSTASSPELLGVMLLVWLPQDADMNICETVRGAMKALSRHPIQRGSEDALWAAIKVEWKRLAQVIL
ncbi:hypothetical protein MRX96_057758 [Rhipicephalus microplus]